MPDTSSVSEGTRTLLTLPPHEVTPASTPRLNGQISLGSLIQAATVAISVIGSAAGGVYTFGAYVQHLRDEIAVADRVREIETAQTNAVLQKLTIILDRLPDVPARSNVPAPR